MYAAATLLLGVSALIVVALVFIPPEWFDGRDGSEAWVPGSLPAWTPPNAAELSALSEPTGIREVGPGRYVVVLQAYNWAFRPNEVHVPVGAEVTFRAYAVEDYHGFALVGTPIIISLDQNRVDEVTYTFTEPGEHLFVCSDYCGGGHLGMRGKVIVEPTDAADGTAAASPDLTEP